MELIDAWIEGDVFSPNSTEQARNGKSYARAMQAHKLTFQALWSPLLPQLLDFIATHDQELKEDTIRDTQSHCYGELMSVHASQRF